MLLTSSPESSPSVSFGPSTVRWCVECSDERVFEVPPCEDGHGDDCLDLACTACGHAIVVGVLALGRTPDSGLGSGGDSPCDGPAVALQVRAA